MKPQNVTCPECGGPMLSRANRSSGQRFWGCNDYPQCRGTRNTDGDAPGETACVALTEVMGDERLPSERRLANDRYRFHLER